MTLPLLKNPRLLPQPSGGTAIRQQISDCILGTTRQLGLCQQNACSFAGFFQHQLPTESRAELRHGKWQTRCRTP
jgi:hypothetical protein